MKTDKTKKNVRATGYTVFTPRRVHDICSRLYAKLVKKELFQQGPETRVQHVRSTESHLQSLRRLQWRVPVAPADAQRVLGFEQCALLFAPSPPVRDESTVLVSGDQLARWAQRLRLFFTQASSTQANFCFLALFKNVEKNWVPSVSGQILGQEGQGPRRGRPRGPREAGAQRGGGPNPGKVGSLKGEGARWVESSLKSGGVSPNDPRESKRAIPAAPCRGHHLTRRPPEREKKQRKWEREREKRAKIWRSAEGRSTEEAGFWASAHTPQATSAEQPQTHKHTQAHTSTQTLSCGLKQKSSK